MTSHTNDSDWLSPDSVPPPAADAASDSFVVRKNGQGESMRFPWLVDAMREDPRSGDLDARIVDEKGRALAEVEGMVCMRVSLPEQSFVGYSWPDEVEAYKADLKRRFGERASATPFHTRAEWRLTLHGKERLSIDNDRQRSIARRVA